MCSPKKSQLAKRPPQAKPGMSEEPEDLLQRAKQQIALVQSRRRKIHGVEDLVKWAHEPEGDEPVLDKDRPQTEGDSDSESLQPIGWPISDDWETLLDEIMHGVPEEVLEFEKYDSGCCWYEARRVVRQLLWYKPYRDLKAIHMKLFKDHDRDIPLKFASAWRISMMQAIRSNPLPRNFGDDSSESDHEKEEMIQKVSKARLAQTQPDRPSLERKALTNAEVKRKKRWQTTDKEEAAKLKEEKKKKNKEAQKIKKVQDQKERRQKKRESKAGKEPTAPPED